MKILLKSATIIDSTSEHHLSKKDILINNGVIESIADSINVKTNKTVSLENLHVSMGWFDSSISFGEPGYEDRDRKSTRLNSSHVAISYAVFCLKKTNTQRRTKMTRNTR